LLKKLIDAFKLKYPGTFQQDALIPEKSGTECSKKRLG
jgi:hypothetical protein